MIHALFQAEIDITKNYFMYKDEAFSRYVLTNNRPLISILFITKKIFIKTWEIIYTGAFNWT